MSSARIIRRMKWRLKWALGVAAALAMTLPAPALAKGLTERLQVFPSHPRVGRLVTVQLRPYALDSPTFLGQDFAWRVTARSQGHRLRIALARQTRDPYLWSARVRFRSPGRWKISVEGDQASPMKFDVPVRRGRPSLWERLERPFRAQTVPSGSPCPTANPDPRGSLSRIGFVGTAWGPGPVYPAGLGNDLPVLSYSYPPPPDSGWGDWGGNKVNWVRDLAYIGPVLIRGLRLDGPDELRFNEGSLPSLSMRQKGRTNPSYTRVRSPGCYAYQVDGTSFSYTIVFEAKPFGS